MAETWLTMWDLLGDEELLRLVRQNCQDALPRIMRPGIAVDCVGLPEPTTQLSPERFRERLARLSANPDVDILMTPSRTVPRGLLETPPDVLRNMGATGHRRAYEGEYPSRDVTAIGDGWRRLRPVEQHLPFALPSFQTITRDDNWARPFLDTQQEIERKAHALLMRHLTPNQQDLWASRGYFSVIGEASGHRYRIERKSQANVWCVDTQTRYCLQFKENAPLDDLYLAQKLLLETDEMEFIKTANNLTNANWHATINLPQPSGDVIVANGGTGENYRFRRYDQEEMRLRRTYQIAEVLDTP